MTEKELGELTQRCTSYAERTLAIYGQFENVIRILCNCSAKEWWSQVLMFKEEGQKKAMSIIAAPQILSDNFTNELINHTQTHLNRIKLHSPEIWNIVQRDIEVIKEIIFIPNSSFMQFLNNNVKRKTLQQDEWMYFCFNLWLTLRSLEMLFGQYEQFTKNDKDRGININLINTLSQSYFINSIMHSGDDKLIGEMLELNDFEKSPEMHLYQMIQKGERHDYQKIYWLLACLFDIEDNPCSLTNTGIETIEQCLRENGVNITDEGKHDGRISEIRNAIGVELNKYFPYTPVYDERFRRIHEDLQVFLNIRELTEVNSLYFVEYYEDFYRKQLNLMEEYAKQSLQLLFGLLHSGLFNSHKEKVVQMLLESQPHECIDKSYETYIKNHPSIRVYLFEKDYSNILNTHDIEWNGNRDNKTFKLNWHVKNIQSLYDCLIKLGYIGDDADVLSFAHILTGLPLSDKHKLHKIVKIDWRAKDRQSLAFFAGMLKKDPELKVDLTWKEISNLFTYKGSPIPSSMNSEYRNALKSANKYSRLQERVSNIIHPQENKKDK